MGIQGNSMNCKLDLKKISKSKYRVIIPFDDGSTFEIRMSVKKRRDNSFRIRPLKQADKWLYDSLPDSLQRDIHFMLSW